MWVSRPGLGLETDQDHFFEVLVLVSTLLVLKVLVSLVLVSVRITSRLLATEQPWPQYISLQNLGQRVYHKSAGCE